eukprot:scaffold131997_cov18-Prasinocladus_malaysianus.AAC.1
MGLNLGFTESTLMTLLLLHILQSLNLQMEKSPVRVAAHAISFLDQSGLCLDAYVLKRRILPLVTLAPDIADELEARK